MQKLFIIDVWQDPKHTSEVSLQIAMFRTNMERQTTRGDRTPANIYLFKVINWNTRKRCEICSKLTINDLFLTHISHLFLVFLFAVFEQVDVSWDVNWTHIMRSKDMLDLMKVSCTFNLHSVHREEDSNNNNNKIT